MIEKNMIEYDYRENQNAGKILVTFFTGFLIGGGLFWVFGYGHQGSTRLPSENQQSLNACKEAGGIPILGDYDRMTDCKKL